MSDVIPQTTVSPPAHSSETSTRASALGVGPSVFDYRDYRVFLNDWFLWKKQIQPHFSGSVFARKAGLASQTLLRMVTRGERNLSYRTVRAFLKALGLRAKEAAYFESLVLFNQAQDSEEKTFYLNQLQALSRGSGRDILNKLQDHAQFFSHWYTVAIYLMVDTEDFVADPEWIAQRLKRKVTRKQAADTLALLTKLKMVDTDKNTGKMKITAEQIDVDPSSVDFAIRNFHKEYLKRAIDSVDGESLEERELSSLTLSVPQADWPKLRDRLKEIRIQLNNEFGSNKSPRTLVVTINTQALALTTSLKTKERKK